MLTQIDHLLFGVKDLEEGINHIHRLTGVQPVIGGSHPGLGTHNALLGLGNNIYMEIIAPDPKQQVESVWMNLDRLATPKLFRWAASSLNVETIKNQAMSFGIDIGEVKSGSRYKPDGTLLEWTLSDPNVNIGDGLIPFFIEWGAKGNPTPDLPAGCVLKTFKAAHPTPQAIHATLSKLGLSLSVSINPEPMLEAEIECPKGTIMLK